MDRFICVLIFLIGNVVHAELKSADLSGLWTLDHGYCIENGVATKQDALDDHERYLMFVDGSKITVDINIDELGCPVRLSADFTMTGGEILFSSGLLPCSAPTAHLDDGLWRFTHRHHDHHAAL